MGKFVNITWALLPLTFLLAGCTLIPEKVTLEPRLLLNEENIGHKTPVVLTVIDKRPSKELGYRSYLHTGKITLTNNVTEAFKEQIQKILESKGFVVLDHQQTGTEPVCVVTIRNFHYDTVTELVDVVAERRIVIEIEARTATHHYLKDYLGEDESHEPMAPTASHNEDLINRTVEKVLNDVADDDKLFQTFTKESA